MLLSTAAAAGGSASANAAVHCQGTLRADVAPIIKHRSQQESAGGRHCSVERTVHTISCQPPAGLSNNYRNSSGWLIIQHPLSDEWRLAAAATLPVIILISCGPRHSLLACLLIWSQLLIHCTVNNGYAKRVLITQMVFNCLLHKRAANAAK